MFRAYVFQVTVFSELGTQNTATFTVFSELGSQKRNVYCVFAAEEIPSNETARKSARNSNHGPLATSENPKRIAVWGTTTTSRTTRTTSSTNITSATVRRCLLGVTIDFFEEFFTGRRVMPKFLRGVEFVFDRIRWFGNIVSYEAALVAIASYIRYRCFGITVSDVCDNHFVRCEAVCVQQQ